MNLSNRPCPKQSCSILQATQSKHQMKAKARDDNRGKQLYFAHDIPMSQRTLVNIQSSDRKEITFSKSKGPQHFCLLDVLIVTATNRHRPP